VARHAFGQTFAYHALIRLAPIGSVQRMGDHAALANRSFWLVCG
jgi:hypothetical protein